jgi:hypothetical protein
MNVEDIIAKNDFIITKYWKEGLKFVKEKKWDEAQDCFDMGIAIISFLSLNNGVKDDDVLEKVKKEVWLQRFWVLGLENNNLLL